MSQTRRRQSRYYLFVAFLKHLFGYFQWIGYLNDDLKPFTKHRLFYFLLILSLFIILIDSAPRHIFLNFSSKLLRSQCLKACKHTEGSVLVISSLQGRMAVCTGRKFPDQTIVVLL